MVTALPLETTIPLAKFPPVDLPLTVVILFDEIVPEVALVAQLIPEQVEPAAHIPERTLLEMLYVPEDDVKVIERQLLEALFAMVVNVFPVMVINPVPIEPTVSMPVIVVPTYDITFCRVFPVTVAAVNPFIQIPFV
jgi:hypothetical protein